MNERSDQELLHAWLDGALGDEEAARLRERLSREPSLRAEADTLQRLAGLVTSLGPADPPPSFSDRVMEAVSRSHAEAAGWRARARAGLDQLFGRVQGHVQQEGRSGPVARWNTGWAGGGDVVAKKALWAVAGLAVVIILAVVYFNGARTVDQGAQGTIGGAERYRGAQPAGVAVTEGDVEKFLQSDLFDRILKDPHVLNLLTDKQARLMLGSDEVQALMGDKAVSRFLTDDAVEAVLLKPEARQALLDENVVAVLSKQSLVRALKDEDVAAEIGRRKKLAEMLADEDVQAVLTRSAVQRALVDYADAVAVKDQARIQAANAEHEAAVKSRDKFRLMFGDPEVLSVLTKSRSAALLFTDATFLSVMKSDRGRALFMDPGFERALKQDGVANLFVNMHFQEALSKYSKLFDNAEVFSALDNAEFVDVFRSDARLSVALRNSDALDAALGKRAPRKK